MADPLFKEYKKQIISYIGKKALDDVQLKDLGHNLFKDRFIGVYAQDKFPMNKNGFAIVNKDTSKKINTDEAHWVAIYSTKTRLYIYDTFGRSTSFVLPIIFEKAHKHNKKIYESKRDPEQYGYTEVCGQLAMSWLCVVKDLGIKKALTI